jgi:hypothetical protein
MVMTKEEFIEKQKQLGEAISQAEKHASVINKRHRKKVNNKKGVNIRAREDRIKITHEFNHECDKTDQTDAERYSMNTIYNKLKSGEPVLPNAIKEKGQFVELDIEIEDLTQLYSLNENYMRKYGTDLNGALQTVYDSIESDNEKEETKNSPDNSDKSVTKENANVSDEGA